jgi:hypothetical protein
VARGRVASRARRRVAAAMLVTPLSLRAPIARLRKVAMAAGRCRRGPGRRLRRIHQVRAGPRDKGRNNTGSSQDALPNGGAPGASARETSRTPTPPSATSSPAHSAAMGSPTSPTPAVTTGATTRASSPSADTPETGTGNTQSHNTNTPGPWLQVSPRRPPAAVLSWIQQHIASCLANGPLIACSL